MYSKYLVVARRAWETWLENDGTRLAASLALYTLLSLAPLVILSIAMASLVFDRLQVQTALVNEVGLMAGVDGASAIRTILEYGKTPSSGSLASALGVATLLIGASSVFGELRSALNKIWGIDERGDSGLLSFARSRLFSFAMVLALGFLLVVSLIVSTGLSAFNTYYSSRLALPTVLVTVATTVVSLGVLTVLFAIVMKYVPAAATRWKHVFQGAAVTAVLFTIGKSILALYLGKAAVGSAYGAAGSLIVLIVWVYYSAMIFYFGAALTKVRSSDARNLSAVGPRETECSRRSLRTSRPIRHPAPGPEAARAQAGRCTTTIYRRPRPRSLGSHRTTASPKLKSATLTVSLPKGSITSGIEPNANPEEN